MKKLFLSGMGLVFILLLLTGCPKQYTLTASVTGQGTVALVPSGGTQRREMGMRRSGEEVRDGLLVREGRNLPLGTVGAIAQSE
jgi:hypothetical protein